MLHEAIREQSEYAVKLILSVVATNTWNGANNIPVVKIRVICTPLRNIQIHSMPLKLLFKSERAKALSVCNHAAGFGVVLVSGLLSQYSKVRTAISAKVLRSLSFK